MTSREPCILCVGICCMDVIQVCDAYPEEDSDIRSKHGRWQRGGNPANNCTVFALMGLKCEFMGTLSDSAMSSVLLEDFKARGIATKHCVVHAGCETPMSSVLLSLKTGSRTIVHSNPNLPEMTFADFAKCNLAEYTWIHFEPRNPPETRRMMDAVHKWNAKLSESERITVSLELEKPGKHPLDVADLADVVFMSRIYAETELQATDMRSAVAIMRKKVQKECRIVCAWGSEGSAAIDASGEIFCAPSFPPEKVVDSLGAGDTFCAATIYALAHGKSLFAAIVYGNMIAGAKVGFHGYDAIANIHCDMYATLPL
ncbi:ketohexokinase-like [Phlebotomus argentipes]|uniref:ketohexokinase-like n=1 Tax=Phlebotomus argentipes TaxID=94469 RepID=UPI0028934684|nr:ketohexokinase-like [Phlebotomus argentipes]